MDYNLLVECYEALDKTSKRLEKTNIVSSLLKKTHKDDIKEVVYLLQGSVFPPWDERQLGMSSMLVIKALSSITGESKDKVERLWKKEGDLGKVSALLVGNRKQKTLMSSSLTTKIVFDSLRKVAEMAGKGTVDRKIQLISMLLSNANPVEAKYIIKTVLNTLRIGTAEGIMRDAIVWAFFGDEIDFKYEKEENSFDVDREKYNEYVGAVQSAYNVMNDFGDVALIAKTKGIDGLKEVRIEVGKPINPMLAIRVESVQEALDALGKPVMCDLKLDGFRLMIHKKGNEFWLYTRRLESVTKQFAELIPILKNHVKASSYIIDSEVVGYDRGTGDYMPFQAMSQRIKRKYDIEKTAKEIPVEINVFDILYFDGKSLLEKSQKERREILEKIIKEAKKKIVLTKKIVSSDAKEIQKFFDDAIKKGLEGIMIKSLDTKYVSGRKVGGWVKLKTILETLDLVIVEADYGEGKRAKTLSSYTVACRDKNKLSIVGKVSTGVKEKEGEFTYAEITKLLKPLIIEDGGKHVKLKPDVVVEISYEEVQASPNYESGYALRFPRVLRFRPDKGLKDINSINDVKRIYSKQRGKK